MELENTPPENRIEALLDVQDLRVAYSSGDRIPVTALNGISFRIHPGESVGVIGESGSGKSTLAMAILRILPLNTTIVRGRIFFRGVEILNAPEQTLNKIRGALISMVFQQPGMALNPFMRVRRQVAEVIRAHRRGTWSRSLEDADVILTRVFGDQYGDIFDAYPHQLSGGQRQRVSIAQAFACDPELIIADEPAASLDAVTQADILELFRDFQSASSASLMLITHNPAVLPGLVDRLLVLRGGELVEEGMLRDLFRHPRETYTAELLQSALPASA
jgi:ABC-type glutathione transport system ATPase component